MTEPDTSATVLNMLTDIGKALKAAHVVAEGATFDPTAANAVARSLEGELLRLRRSLQAVQDRFDDSEGLGDDDLFDFDAVADTYDTAWDARTVVEDERCPVVEIAADTAFEANVRAVAWARHTRGLNEAIPADSAYLRRRGGGSKQTVPGRWQVTIEGW